MCRLLDSQRFDNPWREIDCGVSAERRSVLDASGEEESADEDITWNVNVYTESSCKLERCVFPLLTKKRIFMLTDACYTTENSSFSIHTDNREPGHLEVHPIVECRWVLQPKEWGTEISLGFMAVDTDISESIRTWEGREIVILGARLLVFVPFRCNL